MQLLRFVVVAAACVVSACATSAPSLSVVVLEPAMLDPRGADRLVLVDGDGAADAKATVAKHLVQALRGGFFKPEDRGPVTFVVVGDSATVAGVDVEAGTLWLRADVLAWNAAPAVVTVDGREVPGLRGRVSLSCTIADATGAVLIAAQNVVGVADHALVVDDEAARRAVIDDAAANAAHELAVLISPTSTTHVLTFDDSDAAQAGIIADPKASLADTEERLRLFLANHKSNASAHFNLAVVLDAQGRYEEALLEQDRALDIDVRDTFFDARSATIRRRDAWERIHGPRPARAIAEDAPATTPAPSTPPPPTTYAPPTPTTMSPEPLTAPVGATAPTIDEP